jgi:hypothetical protein
MISTDYLQHLHYCAAHWAADPLTAKLATMTDAQREAYHDSRMTVLMEGGNQSGKSRTAVLKVVGFALEQVENCFPGQDVNIWYTTTTYDKFAEQAWNHFKEALLWPHESVAKLPTTRIKAINWLGKSPEKPMYFALKRPSGSTAHIYIHTYAQGRSEFQGQTIHLAVVDEECSEEIFTEIWARTLASRGARLVVACTPIEGEPWLDRIRKSADDGVNAKHYRFRTRDNPSNNTAAIEEMEKMFKDVPEELELRLMGIPRLGSALVYSDRIFTGDHLIAYKDTDINPQDWTLNRAIDAGFRHPACVWMAIRNDGKQVILYRSWRGKDLTIAEAAKKILDLSGKEKYLWDIIDPAVMQKSAETGQPEMLVWQANGINAAPAPDNRVRSGIERCYKLMSERVEFAAADGSVILKPRFRVIQETNEAWLEERRKYRIKDVVKEIDRDAVDFRPVKQNDHTMDPFRYLVSAGLMPADVPERPPPLNTPERFWWDQRHKKQKARRK